MTGMFHNSLMRVSSVVECKAHNLVVGGAIPSPATKFVGLIR